MKEIFDLFIIFAKIGAFTFGGGYSMLPIIQRELVDERGWATNEEILNYYAIGQCTPGIIAVNTATFIGYKRKGIPGGISATLGMVFPSVIIITLIELFFNKIDQNPYFKYALLGVRICVCALIANAVLTLFRQNVRSAAAGIIFSIGFLYAAFSPYSPVYIIAAAAFTGVLHNFIAGKNTEGEEK